MCIPAPRGDGVHDFPGVERGVRSADRYEIVQKREGTPAELSEELDPPS